MAFVITFIASVLDVPIVKPRIVSNFEWRWWSQRNSRARVKFQGEATRGGGEFRRVFLGIYTQFIR